MRPLNFVDYTLVLHIGQGQRRDFCFRSLPRIPVKYLYAFHFIRSHVRQFTELHGLTSKAFSRVTPVNVDV